MMNKSTDIFYTSKPSMKIVKAKRHLVRGIRVAVNIAASEESERLVNRISVSTPLTNASEVSGP